MKNAEIKVVSFNKNDVIATSLCTSTANHYVFRIGKLKEGTPSVELNWCVNSGSQMEEYGSNTATLDEFDSSVGINATNYQDTSWVGKWFVKDGNLYVFCDKSEHYGFGTGGD